MTLVLTADNDARTGPLVGCESSRHNSKFYGYVYCTTNNINGKVYIGLKSSQEFNETYLGSGVRLAKAIKHYGRQVFSVVSLVWCETVEDLNEVEKKLIARYRQALGWDNVYNLDEGGYHAGYQGTKRTVAVIQQIIATKQSETREVKLSISRKISQAKKGKQTTSTLGKCHRDETLGLMSEKQKLRHKLSPRSQATIEKWRESRKGWTPTLEYRQKMSIVMKAVRARSRNFQALSTI